MASSTLNAAIAAYIEISKLKGHSVKTLRNKLQFFGQVEKFCGNHPYSLEVIQEFLQAMRDRNLDDSTVAGAVRMLRAFTKWYSKKYSSSDFGLELIKPKLHRKPPHIHSMFLTEKIILAGTEPGPGDNSRNRRIKLEEYRPALQFALRTGLRCSELIWLRGEDINAYEADPSFYVHTKGGNIDKLQIPSDMVEMLRSRANYDRVFKITSSQVNITLKNGCKKLGVRKITCHDLRRTFATDMLLNGATLQVVSRWLRHKNVLVTDQQYSYFNTKDLGESLEVNHSILRQNMSDGDRIKHMRRALIKAGVDENGLTVIIGENGNFTITGKAALAT